MWSRGAPARPALVTAALLAAATGCGGAAASEDDGPVVLRLGHTQSSEDPWQATAEEFAAEVEEATDGEVVVEVYASSQLGGDRELVEGMQIGSVDAAMVAGVLSNVVPAMTLLELPYLFEDAGDARAAFDGEGARQLSGRLEEKGVRTLAWLDRGPRQLTADRPITAPDQLDRAKVRVPEIPASVDAWQAMGANPTPMAFGEVYGALQQGVIDAQENPYAIVDSANLAEVQSHVMRTEHVFGYVMLAVSTRTWAELTPEQRDAVTSVAAEVRAAHNERAAEDEVVYEQALVDAGMTVVDVDRAAFAAAVQPVHEEYADRYGRELYRLLDEAGA